MSIIPEIRPQLLDVLFTQNPKLNRGYPEFGGLHGKHHGGFLPTVETALFIIAGTSLEGRLAHMRLFESGHLFSKQKVVLFEHEDASEPFSSARVRIAPEFMAQLVYDKPFIPRFGPDFPAHPLDSALSWENLVLAPSTTTHLQELLAWLRHGERLMGDWGFEGRLKPGYRCLFYGPPGTGKTLCATLLGKTFSLSAFRIDLSHVVSKYVGETEKNLERIFSQAESRQWILFFDEADALFGRRTTISNANDRFANQETAYLLQRIEEFPGVAILASNMKSNIDEAFVRRFQSTVHFPMPDQELRMKLWAQAFCAQCKPHPKVSMQEISQRHELSGGAIMNVVRYCSLMALEQGENTISLENLEAGIRREMAKEGRTASFT